MRNWDSVVLHVIVLCLSLLLIGVNRISMLQRLVKKFVILARMTHSKNIITHSSCDIKKCSQMNSVANHTILLGSCTIEVFQAQKFNFNHLF